MLMFTRFFIVCNSCEHTMCAQANSPDGALSYGLRRRGPIPTRCPPAPPSGKQRATRLRRRGYGPTCSSFAHGGARRGVIARPFHPPLGALRSANLHTAGKWPTATHPHAAGSCDPRGMGRLDMTQHAPPRSPNQSLEPISRPHPLRCHGCCLRSLRAIGRA